MPRSAPAIPHKTPAPAANRMTSRPCGSRLTSLSHRTSSSRSRREAWRTAAYSPSCTCTNTSASRVPAVSRSRIPCPPRRPNTPQLSLPPPRPGGPAPQRDIPPISASPPDPRRRRAAEASRSSPRRSQRQRDQAPALKKRAAAPGREFGVRSARRVGRGGAQRTLPRLNTIPFRATLASDGSLVELGVTA